MLFQFSCVLRRWEKASLALFLGLLAAPLGLAAEPLDKEACSRLLAEKQTLVVLGVDKQFAKGPEWAKANLAGADLANIRRYLTIDEQLKFRCGMAVVALQVQEEPDEGEEDDGAQTAGAVPIPERRDQAAAAKPAPAHTQPAAVKPAPNKHAPKPASAKAQSSWNTETAPAASSTPAGLAPVEPSSKSDKQMPLGKGDKG